MPAFFFPPLAFFAIVSYPPLHVGFDRESARVTGSVAAAWHAHPDADRPSLREHLSLGKREGWNEKAGLRTRARTLTRDGLSWPPSYQM